MTPEPHVALATVSKYRLIREIGRGSMGSVYLGRDHFIDRYVAIKMAHQERVGCAESGQVYKKLFFNEAQTAGMLMHPNITAIFDAGVENDIHYIVMEYVSGGQTLADYCNVQKLLPIPEVVRIFYKCALALDYAHKKGVIHRDIKPKNILVTTDRDVKITDFGIAVSPDEFNPAAVEHAGSPLYMSPEQIRHERLTGQSDLFSLGIVMYRALSGKHPFMAEGISEINQMILQSEPWPLRELRPEVPEVLERIVRRALAKNLSRRYRSGLDIGGDLSLVLDLGSFTA
jgi:serine/threonine protein kinase